MKAVKPPVRLCRSRIRQQVLDSLLPALPHPEHHGGGRLHPQAVGGLHDLEPAGGVLLEGAHPPARRVGQDLGATSRNRVQPGLAQGDQRVAQVHPRELGHERDLDGREAVHVDRVRALDEAQQVQIPRKRKIWVDPTLQQDLHAAQRLHLVDLGPDLVEREGVGVAALRAGRAVERAELAVDVADVRVVDVAVHDVGDDPFGMEPRARGVGVGPELEERRRRGARRPARDLRAAQGRVPRGSLPGLDRGRPARAVPAGGLEPHRRLRGVRRVARAGAVLRRRVGAVFHQ